MSILIQTNDQTEIQLLLSMLEKMRIKSHLIDDDTLEDMGLALAMKEADRQDKVPKSEVMNLLKSKL